MPDTNEEWMGDDENPTLLVDDCERCDTSWSLVGDEVKQNKFKVGDKVRVKKGIGGFEGHEGEIMRVSEAISYSYVVKLSKNGSEFRFEESELELVGELKEPKIFIFRK